MYDASTPELLSELSRIRSEDLRQVSRYGLSLLLLVKTEATDMADGLSQLSWRLQCASVKAVAQLESSADFVC